MRLLSTSTDCNRILLVLLTVERVAASVFSEMADDAQDKLFHKILNDASHVLSLLLPERRRNELTFISLLTYFISLRTRRQDRTLSQRATRLTDNNFITRQLLQNSYEKAPREMQALRAGCNKAETKIFAPPQTLPGGAERPNLISWR